MEREQSLEVLSDQKKDQEQDQEQKQEVKYKCGEQTQVAKRLQEDCNQNKTDKFEQ